MEFIRLNLRAYGPFTNKVLEFQNGPDKSNLHLLFGPNEAGKSTALRGLQAVLFGMDARDAHLHPADMLRASLKFRTPSGELFDVERRKGRGAKSLLFTESEKPVSLEAWSNILPVNDAELFESMFGLNYERLVEGGRQLAEFKGEIGKSILAAAGDMRATAKRIQTLRADAEDIYAPQAHTRKLNKALRAYKDAEKIIRQERFTSAHYKAAIARQSELVRELDEIEVELARCAEKQSRLTRFQTAAPHVQHYQSNLSELDTLSDVIQLLPDFVQRLNNCTEARTLAVGRRDSLEIDLERLRKELAEIQRDPQAALLLAEIECLNSEVGKIKASREDLPKRETEHRLLLDEQQELCRNLGMLPDTVPQLTTEQRKRVELLSSQYSGLETTREGLPGRIARLQSRLIDLDGELAKLPPDIDTTSISECLSQIPPKKQSGAETKRLKGECERLAARLTIDVENLPLWRGSATQLETARVPLNASVNDMAERFNMQLAKQNQLAKEETNLRSDVARCQGQLAILDRQRNIPTDEQLTAARAHRDRGWTAIKGQWLNGSQDGAAESSTLFESSMTSADIVSDELRREAERVEQKRTALDEQKRLHESIAGNQQAIQFAITERKELDSQWNNIWADAGIQPRTPREMLDWLDKRIKLIEQLRDIQRAAAQADDAEREETQWRRSLAAALNTSPSLPLADLVAKARLVVEKAAESREKRTTLGTQKRETEASLHDEAQSLRENEATLNAWESRWKAALVEAHLNENADPTTALTVVDLISTFWAQSAKIKEVKRRMESMQADDQKYSGAVKALAERTGRDDPSNLDALTSIREIEKLARTGEENEKAATRVEREQSRKQQELGEELASIERSGAAIKELLCEANVTEVSLLGEVIERGRRKAALADAIRSHTKALALSAGTAPVDTFVAEVQLTNPDLLPVELDQLQSRIKLLDVQRTEKSRELDDIDRTFRIKEAAIEITRASFEKNAAAARVDELSTEFLEYQLSATLLESAMARYRLKHQDPILKSASEFFNALTRGAFSGLIIAYENSDRVMKATRANGDSLGVEAMSDGTRDQLFLALRLAYIENHCANKAPCPVILDDVLMAFDDQRASAALEVLYELSKKTQVLIFTHHAHHVKLAESTLGANGFQLHELTAPILQGQVGDKSLS